MKGHTRMVKMLINPLLIAAAVLIAVLPVNAFSEVYRWVDEDGKVHFADRPTGSNAEQVDIKSSDDSLKPDLETEKRLEKQRKLLKVYEEERKEKTFKEAEAREQKRKEEEERVTMCADAKDYKQNAELAGAMYNLDEEGNRVYLNEEEFEAELKRADKLIEEWCG